MDDEWALVESWSMRKPPPFIPYVGETSLHMLRMSLDVNHVCLQSVINNELHVPGKHQHTQNERTLFNIPFLLLTLLLLLRNPYRYSWSTKKKTAFKGKSTLVDYNVMFFSDKCV